MDSKVFGQFIAQIRKEKNMTQADLAKIIGVTDKAISRWERGIGFPDINTLEPLSDALGISVLELMRSERSDIENKDHNLSGQEVTEIMTNAVEMARESQRQDKVALWIGGIVTIAVAVPVILSGRANIGGALVVGVIAVLAVVGAYLFTRNAKDKDGWKIYGFFMLLGLHLFLWLLHMMHVDSFTVVWGVYWFFTVVIGLLMKH